MENRAEVRQSTSSQQDTVASALEVGTQSQQDSTIASDVGAQTQHDTVAAVSDEPTDPSLQVDRPVRLRKHNSPTTTPYIGPCRRKKSKTEAAHKFRPADPVH
ncbi:hypothetical protein Q3G72_002885 [Acer saccharum]|nr:hypothetical protein Q3G72_002885 [Acer saccharum]